MEGKRKNFLRINRDNEKGISVTNEEFLQNIFGDMHIYAHVTSFREDPTDIPGEKRSICWGGDYYYRTPILPDSNQYFTVSLFTPDEKGKARRRKALFSAVYVVALDDVREKLPLEQVNRLPDPSYKLQTSPGSEQWGFILREPCTDRHRFDNLHDGLIRNGLAPNSKDPGQRGVTRYLRLPEGVNTKVSKRLSDGTAPKCQMIEWHPKRRVTLEELAAPFNVDLEAERREQRVDGAAHVEGHPLLVLEDIIQIKTVRSDGRFDITCPWVDEHTGAKDDGAAVFTNADGTVGFRCHHGSCQERTGGDLLQFIEQKYPGFRARLDTWKVMRVFEEEAGASAPKNEAGPASLDFMGDDSSIPAVREPNVIPKNLHAAALGLRPIEFCDLAHEINNPRPHVWQIDGLVEVQTTGSIFGASTAGKSFLAVSLAMAVATEDEFLGAAVIKSGPVIYFAGEGRHGIPKRANAWLSERGKILPPGRVILPRGRIEFDATGAALAIKAIEEMAEPPAMVIIDTVARSLPSGSDENSAKDMMQFINAVDGIRDRFGCTVVLVHHTGHGADSQTRARGSSSFRAAMDWEILVDKTRQQVRFTKMKDSEIPKPLKFELIPLHESAVFRTIDSPGENILTGLTNSEEFGAKTLRICCETKGRDYTHLEEWREEFYRKHTGDKVDSKRKAFNRVRESLIAKGIAVVDNDIYKLTGTISNVPGHAPACPGTDGTHP